MLFKSRLSVLLVSILFIVAACGNKKQKETPQPDASEGTYFSIRQFVSDQWETFHGQPFAIAKVVTVNGKTDSIMTNADKLDWGSIFKIFFATDISDPKFLGKYDFSQFADDATASNNFYYEAKEPDLFTRKLHIISDDVTNKIKSIYIETEQKTKWGSRIQRLFYIPVKTISIQEFESTTTGDKKELRVEYRFM